MGKRTREIPLAPRLQEPGDQNMNERLIGNSLALQMDPMELAVVQEYVEAVQTHSRYSVFALRNMAKTPWDSCIIHTRLNQVDLFSQPQEGPYSLGFAIQRKEKEGNPTAADKKEIERLTKLMMQCGEYQQPHHKFTRSAFGQFLREIVYDSLVLDAMTFEIVPAAAKRAKDGMPLPVYWHSVDAGTIFRASPNNPYNEYDADDCMFMQIMNEQQMARWRPGELAFGIRRSRTDVRNNGYGFPELCEMIDIVTGLLYGLVHNMNYFKQGGPRGVLAVMGQMPERQFRFFQKQFLYAASGVKNAFRMILANPQGADADLKWVPFGVPNKDMEFAEWNNFLFKLMCSLRQIDPAEVGIQYNTAGDREPLFSQSPEAKIQSGRDKGLRPLLNFVARTLNLYLVERLNPDFEIRFLGAGSMSEKEEADLDATLMNGPRTINEVRAIKQLPSLGEVGDVLQNASWLQYKQNFDANQQPDEGGGFGDEGAPDGAAPGADGDGAGDDDAFPPPPGFEEVGKALDPVVHLLRAIPGVGVTQKIPVAAVGLACNQQPPFAPGVDYDPADMRKEPPQLIPLAGCVATQPDLDLMKVERFILHPELGTAAGALPVMAERNGTRYILDGHHRIAAAMLKGDRQINGHMVTLRPDVAQKSVDTAVDKLLQININL